MYVNDHPSIPLFLRTQYFASRPVGSFLPPFSLNEQEEHHIYTHTYIDIRRRNINQLTRTSDEPKQLFSNLVDHCFVSCIDDFSSKALSGKETGCVSRCVQKHMSMSQRLSERFQEHNALLQQQQQQQGGLR